MKFASLMLALGLAAVSGLAGCSDSKAPAVSKVAEAVKADAVFAASFPDLEGKAQPLKQWRGKVMVLNFWAPWCPPCREEIPDFIQVQEQYRAKGVVFVGVAIDEAQNVQSFADETGINYPILLGGTEGVELSAKVGNRLGGLPYTVIIDREGNIVTTQVGGLSRADLEGVLRKLL